MNLRPPTMNSDKTRSEIVKPSEKWPCYRDTAIGKFNGSIQDEEYYHYLLRHLTGETHENDIENCKGPDSTLEKWDAFAYMIQTAVREIGPVEDITPFELVFGAYRTGTVDDVIAQHDKLEEKHAKYVRGLLAMRSVLDKRADVLRFSLEKAGFEYTQKFIDKAYLVSKKDDPETYAALEQSEFRKLHPRKDPPWVVFDVGGALPVNW